MFLPCGHAHFIIVAKHDQGWLVRCVEYGCRKLSFVMSDFSIIEIECMFTMENLIKEIL